MIWAIIVKKVKYTWKRPKNNYQYKKSEIYFLFSEYFRTARDQWNSYINICVIDSVVTSVRIKRAENRTLQRDPSFSFSTNPSGQELAR